MECRQCDMSIGAGTERRDHFRNSFFFRFVIFELSFVGCLFGVVINAYPTLTRYGNELSFFLAMLYSFGYVNIYPVCCDDMRSQTRNTFV